MSLADLAITEPLKRCVHASALIYSGQYEQAKEVMGDLWRGVGERPPVDAYPAQIAAEALLQCGCLSGFLADAQAVDLKESAKDLLSEARQIFQEQKNTAKVSETNYELGIAYYRKGAYEEARVVLGEALGSATNELQGKIVIGKAIIEIATGHCEEARDILVKERSFFDTASDALKGRWHAHMGVILRRMSRNRTEYFDRAIIEYTAAIYHYELAGHVRYCGDNLNNLAFLLYKLGRYADAHEQLDRAHLIFSRLRDQGHIAQVEETRARAFIAEGKYVDALRVIKGVVEILERGGESALLVDALTNKAIIHARLGNHVQSSQTYKEAIKLGEESGARFNVGLAAISMIEELKLTSRALFRVYRTADECLSKTQDEEMMSRLRGCARVAINQLGGPQLDKNFTLKSAMHFLESKFIEEALTKAEGRITKAASLLGVSHQALRNMLDNRHQDLLTNRTPLTKRRKSIIKHQ
jgi:tetratricopeptide (TPR) repeat protein